MTIPWNEYVFAALEAVFNEDTQRITLYGHNDARCKKIVGKTAPKTSLVQYLEARGRSGEKFPEPWPCSCVDVIDVQLAAIDKAAEKVVPAASLQARVEDLAAKMTGATSWTVMPDPTPPAASAPTPATPGALTTAIVFLRSVDIVNEKFEFLRDLATKMQANPSMTLTEKQVDAVIRTMNARSAPRKPKSGSYPGPTVDLTLIPKGRYAAYNSQGGITFLRVDRPTSGEWAGWVFVKQVIGGQPDQKFCSQKPGHPYRGSYSDLLQKIIDDIPAAELLYGTQLGLCFRCNRTLTDTESRRLGIGPECRRKA